MCIVWSCSIWKTIRAASKRRILACFNISIGIYASLETWSRSKCPTIQTASIHRAGTTTTTSASWFWFCWYSADCPGSEGRCAGSRCTGCTGGSCSDCVDSGSRLIGKGNHLRTSPTIWTNRCGYPVKATSKVRDGAVRNLSRCFFNDFNFFWTSLF